MRLNELFESTKSTYTSVSGEIIHRISVPGGHLDFSEDDGVYLLDMVEVEPSARNKGIATVLLEDFFSLVAQANGSMMLTTFLEDGEKYLKNVIEQLKKKYSQISYL